MSGLLDMFVRRRRASAATRLGPQTQNGRAHLAPESPPAPPPEPVVEEPAYPPVEPPAAPPAPEPPPRPPASRVQARPAPVVEAPPTPRRHPSSRSRPQMRRRARYLRQLRELQLRDIGGFLVECYRFNRARPDLVETKLQEALETDGELRALERSLGDERPRHEVRQPGIGGSCPECGSVHGSGDRFCAWCGHRL
ncbi:MAG TPA: zinc ribbon domain-containing protein [Solirubrobacteraceae bacterium]|nr:zinc ribbon domain-containing protein [Solirubrobacteraceae bacterium]